MPSEPAPVAYTSGYTAIQNYCDHLPESEARPTSSLSAAAGLVAASAARSTGCLPTADDGISTEWELRPDADRARRLLRLLFDPGPEAPDASNAAGGCEREEAA
jgi:hypothetical protein